MFKWLFKLFGREYVRCEVCNKETEPSIIFGPVCSPMCLKDKHDAEHAVRETGGKE